MSVEKPIFFAQCFDAGNNLRVYIQVNELIYEIIQINEYSVFCYDDVINQSWMSRTFFFTLMGYKVSKLLNNYS